MTASGSEAATPEDVSAHLERRDPDRWLSARLVDDAAARGELLALYAFEDAVRSVAGQVSQPMLGEMRFAWWSEAVEEAASGKPVRAHPALQGIAPALAEGRLRVEPLHRLIAARHADLDAEPFADAAHLDRFLENAYAQPMQAAAQLLDPAAVQAELGAAGRAWGLAALIRDLPRWRDAGRRWAPPDWGDDPAAWTARARAEVAAALKAARPQLKALPVAAFPAVAHAALARDYASGKAPGPLAKRARLLWASALGSL